MPYAPKRPCTYPGCGELTDSGRCEAHRRQPWRELDRQRGSASERGYNVRWRRARQAFLARSPLCAECQRNGRVEAATVVDHIQPHRGNMALFWDSSNWQSLCKACHDRKTSRELRTYKVPGGGVLNRRGRSRDRVGNQIREFY